MWVLMRLGWKNNTLCREEMAGVRHIYTGHFGLCLKKVLTSTEVRCRSSHSTMWTQWYGRGVALIAFHLHFVHWLSWADEYGISVMKNGRQVWLYEKTSRHHRGSNSGSWIQSPMCSPLHHGACLLIIRACPLWWNIILIFHDADGIISVTW